MGDALRFRNRQGQLADLASRMSNRKLAALFIRWQSFLDGASQRLGLSEVADQNHVAGLASSGDEQLLAVA